MMEDRRVCKTNTSKEQLEGFMELLEKQINDRIGVEKVAALFSNCRI